MSEFGNRGGSLNEIRIIDKVVIKSYNGIIPRGYEKLIEEADYLRNISFTQRNKDRKLFPEVIDLINDRENKSIELRIEKIDGIAFSKLILSNQINSNDARDYICYSIDILLNNLFCLNNGVIDPKIGYKKYHSNRISLSRKYLRRLPYLEPILDSSVIYVNGIKRPSFNTFIRFLDEQSTKIFKSKNLVSVHGNFHLDNILIKEALNKTKEDVMFIDPRGDQLGYPHYDFSKILITLEGYYDEIHYNKYNLDYKKNGKAFEFNLEIDTKWSPIYKNCLSQVREYFDEFHKLESHYSKHEYVLLIYSSMCIHILSFIFYHAFRLNPDTKRIRAYFALLFLFADKLINVSKNKSLEIISNKRILEN